MAPEVLKNEEYSVKADIWSLGVVLYEILFGKCPYEEGSIAELIGAVSSKQLEFPLHINNVTPEAINLLKAMLEKDPNLRISWDHLLKIKFDS